MSPCCLDHDSRRKPPIILSQGGAALLDEAAFTKINGSVQGRTVDDHFHFRQNSGARCVFTGLPSSTVIVMTKIFKTFEKTILSSELPFDPVTTTF